LLAGHAADLGKSAINVQASTGPTPGIDVSSWYRCAIAALPLTNWKD
jgi:hypothetical protein